jgi:tetratricopeptide (TPR) repeat protein
MVEGRLRIAVYAIARDEALHVERFMASVAEADVVCIADTGSRDGTTKALSHAGVQTASITIDPWRFDDARNAALALVPPDVDVCVSLDLDEVIQPGWRNAVRAAWSADTTRLSYPFVASWNADGSPGVTFWNNRIHARRGYRWRLPIHEVLAWYGPGREQVVQAPAVSVHHYPDESKSRGSYLALLVAAVADAPDDPRLRHYLGREYTYYGRHEDAVAELRRALQLPANSWDSQRAEACRLIARSFDALGQSEEALGWYWRGVAEQPRQRENWVALAYALYDRGDHAGGYHAAWQALRITERSVDHFSEPAAWGDLPHDLLANCAWRIGREDEALEHATRAAALNPADARLAQNVEWLQQHVGPARRPAS